jgi:hypothetical protein
MGRDAEAQKVLDKMEEVERELAQPKNKKRKTYVELFS